MSSASFAAVVLAALSLLAQDAAHPFAGAYRFQTDDRGPDGQPVCSETWTFTETGEMTVNSGEEVVQNRYRVERDADGSRWLVTEQVSTNRLPDCMGQVSDGVRPGEHRTYLLISNSGHWTLCGPPARMPDGALFVGPTCYGSARPAG